MPAPITAAPSTNTARNCAKRKEPVEIQPQPFDHRLFAAFRFLLMRRSSVASCDHQRVTRDMSGSLEGERTESVDAVRALREQQSRRDGSTASLAFSVSGEQFVRIANR